MTAFLTGQGLLLPGQKAPKETHVNVVCDFLIEGKKIDEIEIKSKTFFFPPLLIEGKLKNGKKASFRISISIPNEERFEIGIADNNQIAHLKEVKESTEDSLTMARPIATLIFNPSNLQSEIRLIANHETIGSDPEVTAACRPIK